MNLQSLPGDTEEQNIAKASCVMWFCFHLQVAQSVQSLTQLLYSLQVSMARKHRG